MLLFVRANTTKQVTIGGQQVTMPDFSIPDRLNATAHLTDPGDVYVRLEDDVTGKSLTFLISGPYVFNSDSWYYVHGHGPVQVVLERLLGTSEVKRALDVLRNSSAARQKVKELGFRLIRNSSGDPVGVMPPHCIAGQNPRALGMGGEDPETAPVLSDLE